MAPKRKLRLPQFSHHTTTTPQSQANAPDSNLSRFSDSDASSNVIIERSPWQNPLSSGKLIPRSEIQVSHDPSVRFPNLSYLNHPSEREAYNLHRSQTARTLDNLNLAAETFDSVHSLSHSHESSTPLRLPAEHCSLKQVITHSHPAHDTAAISLDRQIVPHSRNPDDTAATFTYRQTAPYSTHRIAGTPGSEFDRHSSTYDLAHIPHISSFPELRRFTLGSEELKLSSNSPIRNRRLPTESQLRRSRSGSFVPTPFLDSPEPTTSLFIEIEQAKRSSLYASQAISAEETSLSRYLRSLSHFQGTQSFQSLSFEQPQERNTSSFSGLQEPSPFHSEDQNRPSFQFRQAYPFVTNPTGLENNTEVYARAPVTRRSRKIANKKNKELAIALANSYEDIEPWYNWLTRYANGQITMSSYTPHPDTSFQTIPAPVSAAEIERARFFREAGQLIENSEVLAREEGLSFHLRRLTRTLGGLNPDMVSLSLFTEHDEAIIASNGSNAALTGYRRLARVISIGYHAMLQAQGEVFSAQNLEQHELFMGNPFVAAFHLKCYVAVPIYGSGHVIGLLALYLTQTLCERDIVAVQYALSATVRKVAPILATIRGEVRAGLPPRYEARGGGGGNEGQEGPTRLSWLRRLRGLLRRRERGEESRPQESALVEDALRRHLLA